MNITEFVGRVSKKGGKDRCVLIPRKDLDNFKSGDHVLVRMLFKRGDNV